MNQSIHNDKFFDLPKERPLLDKTLTSFYLLLQTFLECVRLRTFSRYGLQQIQVDTHYLDLYLWKFVDDEK
jgi:hypothetical protein